MNSTVLKRNNVTILGEGIQPMVFAHGFGCDQNMWRYIWPAFAKDYKIVLFDYVGCGRSDMSAYNEERYRNLNGYAQDLLDVCEVLDLQNIVFVGHSVSSIVGILAAIKQPSLFLNLILVGPSPRYINDAPAYTGGFEQKDIVELLDTMEKNYIGWANFLGPAIMKNADRPELAEELTTSFCATDPVMARNFAKATFLSDNRNDVSKIDHSALIMQCSDDLIAPLEVGYFMRDHLKNGVLEILQATGHCPHMSAPDETIMVMKKYLSNNGKK